jgi:hypothetical protein
VHIMLHPNVIVYGRVALMLRARIARYLDTEQHHNPCETPAIASLSSSLVAPIGQKPLCGERHAHLGRDRCAVSYQPAGSASYSTVTMLL